MKDARSEHIHTTASAISADLPKRPMRWQPTTYLWTVGAPKSRSPIAVSITPGHTALIRIPLLAFSSAAVFVRPITPCLLALLLLLNRSSQSWKPCYVNNRSATTLPEHLPNLVLQA